MRCLVRPQAKAADIAMLKSCGAEIFQADLSGSSAQLEKSFAGSRAAIHLIGSVAPKRGETFEQLHIEQTEKFCPNVSESRSAEGNHGDCLRNCC